MLDYETVQKCFELIAKNAKQTAEAEQKTPTTKENYDSNQSIIDLCQFLSNVLEPIEVRVLLEREKHMSFASNDDINPAPYDLIYQNIAGLVRYCDYIRREFDEEEYGYSQQGKSFD